MRWYTYIGVYKEESSNSIPYCYPEYISFSDEETRSLPPGIPLFREEDHARRAQQHQWNSPSQPSLPPDRVT